MCATWETAMSRRSMVAARSRASAAPSWAAHAIQRLHQRVDLRGHIFFQGLHFLFAEAGFPGQHPGRRKMAFRSGCCCSPFSAAAARKAAI